MSANLQIHQHAGKSRCGSSNSEAIGPAALTIMMKFP